MSEIILCIGIYLDHQDGMFVLQGASTFPYVPKNSKSPSISVCLHEHTHTPVCRPPPFPPNALLRYMPHGQNVTS